MKGILSIAAMLHLAIALTLSAGCAAVADQPEALVFFTNDRPELIDDIDWAFKNADFTFLFFSGLHNGWRNLDKMIDVANATDVDAVINAGDTVLKYLYDTDTDFTWYPSMVQEINAAFLPAAGNHDVWG